MFLFNQFFSAIYYYYLKSNNNNPRLTALLYVGVIQLFIIFLPLLILQNLHEIDISHSVNGHSKFFFLPIIIFWEVLLEIYYNKKRAIALLGAFEKRSESFKKLWSILCIIFIIGPLITLLILAVINIK